MHFDNERRKLLLLAGMSFGGGLILNGSADLIGNLRDDSNEVGHYELRDQPVRTVSERSGLTIPVHSHWNTAADRLSNTVLLRLLGYRAPAYTLVGRMNSGVELLSLGTINGTLSKRYQEPEATPLFYIFDRSILSLSQKNVDIVGDIRDVHTFFINAAFIAEIPALQSEMI